MDPRYRLYKREELATSKMVLALYFLRMRAYAAAHWPKPLNHFLSHADRVLEKLLLQKVSFPAAVTIECNEIIDPRTAPLGKTDPKPSIQSIASYLLAKQVFLRARGSKADFSQQTRKIIRMACPEPLAPGTPLNSDWEMLGSKDAPVESPDEDLFFDDVKTLVHSDNIGLYSPTSEDTGMLYLEEAPYSTDSNVVFYAGNRIVLIEDYLPDENVHGEQHLSSSSDDLADTSHLTSSLGWSRWQASSLPKPSLFTPKSRMLISRDSTKEEEQAVDNNHKDGLCPSSFSSSGEDLSPKTPSSPSKDSWEDEFYMIPGPADMFCKQQGQGCLRGEIHSH